MHWRPGNTVLVTKRIDCAFLFYSCCAAALIYSFLSLLPYSYQATGRMERLQPEIQVPETENFRWGAAASLQLTQLTYQLYCNSSDVLVWCICLLLRAAVAVQAWWRGILARRRAQRRRQAANTIRRYTFIQDWTSRWCYTLIQTYSYVNITRVSLTCPVHC